MCFICFVGMGSVSVILNTNFQLRRKNEDNFRNFILQSDGEIDLNTCKEYQESSSTHQLASSHLHSLSSLSRTIIPYYSYLSLYYSIKISNTIIYHAV